jgi:hypothetical protein
MTDEAFQVLGNLHSLRILQVRGTRIDGGGLQQLTSLADLNELWLNRTGIDNDCCESISALTSLTTLHLDYTPISDEGIVHFSALRNLTALSLTATDVKGDGIRVVSDLPKLKWLDLSQTNLEDYEFQLIQDAVALQRVSIKQTELSNDAVLQLEAARPEVEISRVAPSPIGKVRGHFRFEIFDVDESEGMLYYDGEVLDGTPESGMMIATARNLRIRTLGFVIDEVRRLDQSKMRLCVRGSKRDLRLYRQLNILDQGEIVELAEHSVLR